MNRKSGIFLLLIWMMALTLSFMPNTIRAQEESIEAIKQKLSTITEEEKAIIEQLFIGLQEIEGLERDYRGIGREIEELKMDVSDLEIRISTEEDKYNHNLNTLEEILKSYQRMGPSSYLEIILNSNNITDFLRRINIIRDLAKNTGDVLNVIEEARDVLIEEKNNLNEKLNLIEDRQRDLKETLDDKSKRIREQEDYLKSLESHREYYEMYLYSLQEMMVELEDLFLQLTVELPGIIENSDIPLESLNPKLSLQGIKLTIDEELFNKIIGGNDDLPEIIFEFSTENIDLFIMEYNIKIRGYFLGSDGHSIEFIIEEARFYDFLLEEKTVKDLIGDRIVFDFERILDGSAIKDIKILDNYMELIIDFKLL